MKLWLDVFAWDKVSEPLRSAYFLRLLALCQVIGVRAFRWNGPYDQAGLLDGFWDPTWLYHAASAWNAVVDGPAEPVQIEMGDTIELRWKDHRGRSYVIWWRVAADVGSVVTDRDMKIFRGGLVVDPLHGRLLDLSASKGIPVCAWPLIARGEAPGSGPLRTGAKKVNCASEKPTEKTCA